MLDFMLFSRGKMIDMFMEASLRGEGFETLEDAVEAARLEMQHAFGQGIISKELSLENAHLTLKALFLYTRSPGSERWAKDREFWGDVVDIAVRSDAGLRLLNVFRDERDAHHAYKWMESIHVDKTLPMANRIFVTPMFANEDEINDDGTDDDVEGVGDDGVGVGGGDVEGVDGISGDATVERGDDDGGGVQSLVDRIKILGSRASVVAAVVEFFRPRRGRARGAVNDGETAPTPPPTAFTPDLDLVGKAGRVIGTRQAAIEYRRKVEEVQVAEKPDDGDESEDDDGESSESGDEEELACSGQVCILVPPCGWQSRPWNAPSPMSSSSTARHGRQLTAPVFVSGCCNRQSSFRVKEHGTEALRYPESSRVAEARRHPENQM